MNIYHALNQITAEIEQHLDDAIDYDSLATHIRANSDIMRRLFTLITGISLSEYIRKRRLSRAASDLITSHPKLIDLAIKYGYNNPQSFSRAFTAFHGVKPSNVTENTPLKDFPRLVFNESPANNPDLTYEVISRPAFTLYGGHVDTDNNKISRDAPRFFAKYQREHLAKHGRPNFGMITYNPTREKFARLTTSSTRLLSPTPSKSASPPTAGSSSLFPIIALATSKSSHTNFMEVFSPAAPTLSMISQN